jgi:hypothetical protein
LTYIGGDAAAGELHVRALRFDAYGTPDVLGIVTLPDPVPALGEALVWSAP